MKPFIFAAATVVAMGAAFAAHAENRPSDSPAAAARQVAESSSVQHTSSAVRLAALLAEWDRAGFVAPSKPSQYRVSGRNGAVTSGPGYNAMASLIRSAVADVKDGRDQDAQSKIAAAESLLAATNSRRG